jgi:hypothetical protein
VVNGRYKKERAGVRDKGYFTPPQNITYPEHPECNSLKELNNPRTIRETPRPYCRV